MEKEPTSETASSLNITKAQVTSNFFFVILSPFSAIIMFLYMFVFSVVNWNVC